MSVAELLHRAIHTEGLSPPLSPAYGRRESGSGALSRGRASVALAVFLAGLVAVCQAVVGEAPHGLDAKGHSWQETMLANRTAFRKSGLAADKQAAWLANRQAQIAADYPVAWDWALQDAGLDFLQRFVAHTHAGLERQMLTRVLSQLGETAGALRSASDRLIEGNTAADDPSWLSLYVQACQQRRAARLHTLLTTAPKVIFTRRPTVRPSFFAYTEGQSDAQAERHFIPGAALCLLEMEGLYGKVRPLLEDHRGVIRDPAVSYDARHLLFAWKKSLNDDDYHLYEMELATGDIRQLTFGLGFADYEPAYLPSGDVIFASTRCVQTVDCWWTEVSNLYTCDKDGRYLRRLGFDQVHTVFPQVVGDGRVIYTRWDYNDRGQVFPQALFQMNPDGTGQTEFYGNNSWFPTTIAHARAILGTQKVLAILCGHHSTQAGKLAIIDPAKGRQENHGVQLVAPVRETKAERIDSYGQEGELFQYPYPLNERECLVAYAPLGWESQGRENRRKGDASFGIYWMDVDGHRELLVADRSVPCQQPVPLVARSRPPVRPNMVDYRQQSGTYYMQDIYAGQSMAGTRRGTVKKLRVVALEFRPAGIGNNGSSGPGGGALISTPIAIGNGSWDVKVVLGDAKVHDDGSAFFTVPARTPVYFQALDARNHVVQTMRSWSTLQPGENQSCVGCHEHKNSAPLSVGYGTTQALKAGPQCLEPFYGPPRGFSFPKEVQPVLDRHCVRCHNDRQQKMTPRRMEYALAREPDGVWNLGLQAAEVARCDGPVMAQTKPLEGGAPNKSAFSLLGDPVVDRLAKRQWSDAYLNLTLAELDRNDWARGSYRGLYDGRLVNWIGSQSIPALLPPYAAGSARSELFSLLAQGHYGVQLTQAELDKLACWIDLLVPYCGDYLEANAWTAEELQKYRRYLDKRLKMEQLEQRNIEDLLSSR